MLTAVSVPRVLTSVMSCVLSETVPTAGEMGYGMPRVV